MSEKLKIQPGEIKKFGKVKSLAITDEELSAVNKYALNPLTEDKVYLFKMAICDNQIDRHFEKFSDECLEDLAKLFEGRTVIADHVARSENQCARIYRTSTETDGDVKKLIAYCYIVKTEKSESLIAEIDGGIKKEVSVGCRIGEAICSECGTDNVKHWCEHYPGRKYTDEKVCYFTLDKALDAYEVSFVAVPAQINAGVTKNYGGIKKTENKCDLNLQLQMTDTFLFIKSKEMTEE